MWFLLIEDNEVLVKVVLDCFGMDGYVVDYVGDFEIVMEFIVIIDYDLILLDIMLLDGDGCSFLMYYCVGKFLMFVIVLIV